MRPASCSAIEPIPSLGRLVAPRAKTLDRIPRMEERG